MKSLYNFMIMKDDNALRKFVYLIVQICRNTFKSFLSQILYSKSAF